MSSQSAEFLTELLSLFDLRFNPGVDVRDLKELEALLGVGLPELLRNLYLWADGFENHSGALALRLLSTSEVRELIDLKIRGIPPEATLFFTDDEDNYVGLYLSGDLEGKLFLLNHEESDYSPRYRSLSTFFCHLVSAVGSVDFVSIFDLAGDYPSLTDRLIPRELERDRALSRQYRARYDASIGDARMDVAFNAMALLPYADTPLLENFALDPDFYIAARACELIGLREWKVFIPTLRLVALEGVGNAPGAAAQALGRIRIPEAADVLLELLSRWPANSRIYAAWALEGHGYTVVREGGVLRLRSPGGLDWLEFPAE